MRYMSPTWFLKGRRAKSWNLTSIPQIQPYHVQFQKWHIMVVTSFATSGLKCSPCWARWQRANSIWRRMGEASLLALATIHGKAPSSMSNDLPVLYPAARRQQNLFLWIQVAQQMPIKWQTHHDNMIKLSILLNYAQWMHNPTYMHNPLPTWH
jgi:hypothetical protein